MGDTRSGIRRFGLYGEGAGVIEPEFVHIETISARSSLHNWTIAPHLHPGIFQLTLITGGGGQLITDAGAQAMTPPQLVLLPCGCMHAFSFDPGSTGWVLSVADTLAADPRLASVDTDMVMRGDKVTTIGLADRPAQRDLLTALLRELERRHKEAPGHLPNPTVALIALVLALTEELALHAADREAGRQSPRIALVRRFTRLVEAQFGAHWPVERYAAELGTTAPTLTRACREVTGKPPGRIVLDRLLREAMRALSYTDVSIGRIAEDLGFDDPAYFARLFRKHSGMTASEFRSQKVRLGGAFTRPAAVLPR